MRKRQTGDLAIFGGQALFDEVRHVGRPNIGDRSRFFDRVNAMFDERRLTNNGPNVLEFEARIAELTGAPHCIAVCNATIGLELVARALGLRGEVIVPSFTFVATAHALNWLGLEPVFCDVDPNTHTLDPDAAERLVTPRTSAILGVHTWGRVCDVPALSDVAGRRGLRLIFDAAHAFACGRDDAMVGTFGDAEVFSFHATKFLNSFEGGAITTRDPILAERLRHMRNFGFAGLDTVVSAGTNGKMTEISAAMGITSLESIDTFIARNRANYELYRQELAGIDGVTLYTLPAEHRSNYQYVVLLVDEAIAGISRDMLVEILHAEGVFARRYFFPGIHTAEPYRRAVGNGGASLPVTDRLVRQAMQLPTGTAMSSGDVKDVSALLAFIVRHADALSGRLRALRSAS